MNELGEMATASPLIIYVHVPKTAGSTVKKVLSLCTPKGEEALERRIGNCAFWERDITTLDWAAGHIQRDTIAKILTWSNKPIEYYSVVREPTAQLASMLNFSFERHSHEVLNPRHYFDPANENQRRVDFATMSTDFSKQQGVINLLLQFQHDLLNVQSRLILGEDYADLPDDSLRRRLSTYACVARMETNLPDLFRSFGFRALPPFVDELKENCAARHFDPAVFYTPAVQAFLNVYHRHDIRLYEAVGRMSWPAVERPRFRPSLLAEEVFTAENFDEETYLFSHPDVAADVARGIWESGRDHFDVFGRKEGRRIRRWHRADSPP